MTRTRFPADILSSSCSPFVSAFHPPTVASPPLDLHPPSAPRPPTMTARLPSVMVPQGHAAPSPHTIPPTAVSSRLQISVHQRHYEHTKHRLHRAFKSASSVRAPPISVSIVAVLQPTYSAALLLWVHINREVSAHSGESFGMQSTLSMRLSRSVVGVARNSYFSRLQYC